MQSTSAGYKTAISQPGRTFRSRITFPAYPTIILDDLYIVNINHTSSLLTGSDFEIGTATMDTVSINLIDESNTLPNLNPTGYEANIEIAVETTSGFEYISLGLFKIEKVLRKNNTVYLEGIDRMHKTEEVFVNPFSSPQTLLAILQAACSQSGITLATTSFANSTYTVSSMSNQPGITCRKIIAQIAELAGGYAKINRVGQLSIITLGTTVQKAITKDAYIDFKRDDAAQVGISKVTVKTGSVEASAGTGTNVYTIVDNIFAQNPSALVTAIYNVLKDVSYIGCEANWQGDMSLDLQDKITIDGYNTYVFSRQLVYRGGLREKYRAAATSFITRDSIGLGNMTLDVENLKTDVKIALGEISLVVTQEGELYKVNTASIVAAVNESGSTVTINADKIKLGGTVTFDSLLSPGTTKIDGGSIKADTLSVISANLGECVAGILTGITIRTAQTGDRIQLSGNSLKVYEGTYKTFELAPGFMDFFNKNNGAKAGHIWSGTDQLTLYGGPDLNGAQVQLHKDYINIGCGSYEIYMSKVAHALLDSPIYASGEVITRGMLRCGVVSIACVANQPTSVTITGISSPRRPRIVVCADSTLPYTVVETTHANVTEVYTNNWSFDIYIYRQTSVTTSVVWFALVSE